MAKIMESKRQKTSKLLRSALPVSVILIFLLSLSPDLSIADQSKVVRVIDGDTIKVLNNGKTSTIRLVGIDAPETSKKKNETGQPFSQTSTKHLASLVLNKFVDIKNYGIDRYGRTLAVVYCNGANVNLEMVKAGSAEVYRGQPAKGFVNDPYCKAEKEARRVGRAVWSLGDKYVGTKEWRRRHK
jgi:micrococcal nuclease